jgi:hypothetical protein
VDEASDPVFLLQSWKVIGYETVVAEVTRRYFSWNENVQRQRSGGGGGWKRRRTKK